MSTERGKYSDLPLSLTGSGTVVVVRPSRTIITEKDVFLAQEDVRQRIFKEVLNFTGLTHAATLVCSHGYHGSGKPIDLRPCGGTLSLRPVADAHPWMKGVGDFFVTCSEPRCEMAMCLPNLDKQEISNVMMHLMLKQMVPNLPTCNYIDCTQAEDESFWPAHPSNATAKGIRALGLISVATHFLYGTISSNNYFSNLSKYNCCLGFMLMPGMKTLIGCDGFDEWLKFLFEKKFQATQEHHRNSAGILLGPKPCVGER